MSFKSAKISYIEYYLPEQILTNEELQTLYPRWSSEKIYSKTGISTRHIASQDECASDLGYRAAYKLFNQSNIKPEDIDVLIFCTQTPDYCLPTSACILQDRLGLPNSCASFDINLGCSGFVYGLSIAKAYICSEMARNVLLITADTYSKVIHPLDKSVRTIFGDAGTATIISSNDGIAEIGSFDLGTDGSGYKNFIVPTSGFRIPKSSETSIEKEDESGNIRSLDNLYMNGSNLFSFTLDAVPKTIEQLLQKVNLNLSDIDWFIMHQANRFMLRHLTEKLNIPEIKVPICLEQYGNTVSSSIPITLRDCQKNGLFKNGDLLMLIGFGVGYSWGSVLLKWMGEDKNVS
ncbi:TPA: ketoacyl-ACP synthase III [Candidatus Poribacteria bacterium]|nr:ketoacyl-ACP synthase III [Candidatus Poribacteria bacterium]